MYPHDMSAEVASESGSSLSLEAPSASPAPLRTVSLRELNQYSGRIVHGVEENRQAVTVTDRGRPIVRSVPIDPEERPYERLVREGKVRPAKRRRHIPVVAGSLPKGMTLQQLLDEDREEIDLDVLR